LRVVFQQPGNSYLDLMIDKPDGVATAASEFVGVM
jgi:hypothetical protein